MERIIAEMDKEGYSGQVCLLYHYGYPRTRVCVCVCVCARAHCMRDKELMP